MPTAQFNKGANQRRGRTAIHVPEKNVVVGFVLSRLRESSVHLWAQFTQDAENLATGIMQISEHIMVNGSVHTGCKQHQRVCTQICMQMSLRVLCELGLMTTTMAM